VHGRCSVRNGAGAARDRHLAARGRVISGRERGQAARARWPGCRPGDATRASRPAFRGAWLSADPMAARSMAPRPRVLRRGPRRIRGSSAAFYRAEALNDGACAATRHRGLPALSKPPQEIPRTPRTTDNVRVLPPCVPPLPTTVATIGRPLGKCGLALHANGIQNGPSSDHPVAVRMVASASLPVRSIP
jgi:hypothetical protein